MFDAAETKATLPKAPRLSIARRSRTRFIGACLTLASVAQVASADIYRYVDKDGVIHFTNKTKKGKRVANKKKTRSSGFLGSDKSVERFTRYDDHIREAGALYQIPESLVRAVIKVESNFRRDAVSPVGARGLMQMMPGTAKRMRVLDIRDPRQNILGGVRYLRILANLFNGSLVLTLAAYNAGENAVMKYGGIPPYKETQQYVTKVLYWYRRLQAAELEGKEPPGEAAPRPETPSKKPPQ